MDDGTEVGGIVSTVATTGCVGWYTAEFFELYLRHEPNQMRFAYLKLHFPGDAV